MIDGKEFEMRRRHAVLIAALAVLISLPGSAASGEPFAVAKRHHSSFNAVAPVPFFFPPVVFGHPVPVIVPVPVAVPVVVVPAPPTAETIPPPPPSPSPEEVPSRPTVVNPGPKIIDISPPAPGTKTVTVTVHRGSSTVVETVPVH